jgi:hypothetical protein
VLDGTPSAPMKIELLTELQGSCADDDVMVDPAVWILQRHQ